MNITHLKYAVEIAKTGSITQAAENLYMSQPNLSKAIKEFEGALGFNVFKRTSRGIEPTKRGTELIECAKELLTRINEIDRTFLSKHEKTQSLSVSVPRASYISDAFTKFINTLDRNDNIDIDFCETNTVAAISAVADGESDLGVVRFSKQDEKYFFTLIAEKGLDKKLLLEYRYKLIFSKNSPLASLSEIKKSDLEDMIEITHGDLSVPFLPAAKIKSRAAVVPKKRIRVYERGSQFDLLCRSANTFMWVSPMPKATLDALGLVQADCTDADSVYSDWIIKPADSNLKKLQKRFIEILQSVREEL